MVRPPLEGLPAYKGRPLQIPYPPFPGVLTRVTLTDPRKFLLHPAEEEEERLKEPEGMEDSKRSWSTEPTLIQKIKAKLKVVKN